MSIRHKNNLGEIYFIYRFFFLSQLLQIFFRSYFYCYAPQSIKQHIKEEESNCLTMFSRPPSPPLSWCLCWHQYVIVIMWCKFCYCMATNIVALSVTRIQKGKKYLFVAHAIIINLLMLLKGFLSLLHHLPFCYNYRLPYFLNFSWSSFFIFVQLCRSS